MTRKTRDRITGLMIAVLAITIAAVLIYSISEKNNVKAREIVNYEHPMGGEYELSLNHVSEIDERNVYERDFDRVIAVEYTFSNVSYEGDEYLNVTEDNWECYDKDGKRLECYNIGYAGDYLNSNQAYKGESVTKTVLYGINSDENYIRIETRDPAVRSSRTAEIEMTW